VRNAGDFNDDGYDDVIIGAYGVNSLAGAVYVIFGSKNGLSDLTVSSNSGSNQVLAIFGINANDRLGVSVSSAGDVNGDGIDDILMGADQSQGTKGTAYVIYGSKNLPSVINLAQGLSINQGFVINGAVVSDYLGADVSWAGDINKDGIDDIIVGAYGVSGAKGAAYVIFGKQGTRNAINVASGLGSSEGFAILGANLIDGIGSRVSGAGDFDGDGIDDIIITAYGSNGYTGAAYLIYGKDGSSNTFSTIDLTGGLPLSQGFKITGAYVAGQFGAAVGYVGDFNGDGRSDIIIAAPKENADEGKAYVGFGGPRNQLLAIDLSSGLNPSRGISIKRTVSPDNLGYSVNGAGDINGDGIDDIIVGAPGADVSAGRTFVIFGSRNFGSEINLDNGLTGQQGFTLIGDLSGDYLGFSVCKAGDVNGDGMTDFIVSAAGADSSTGAAFLFFSPRKELIMRGFI